MRSSLPVVLLLAAALTGCSAVGERPAGPTLAGRVTRVVDGDTVHVRLRSSGRDETVRLIGIDTPETAASPRGAQCFGAQATRAHERLAAGEAVGLQLDRERRDRYGRLLAYVTRSRDGVDVNAALLEGGFARPLVIRPNVRREERYDGLAREARRRGRGLWVACRPRSSHRGASR